MKLAMPAWLTLTAVAACSPGDSWQFKTRENPPPALRPAQSSSISIRIAGGGCSATRVAEDLLLSAAHCVHGFSGDEARGPISIERAGTSYLLQPADVGQFRPSDGKMQDWLLLSPLDGAVALEGIAIAELATPSELNKIIEGLSAALDDTTRPVWAITFPGRAFRAYPRTPLSGGVQFASRGALKSDNAYTFAAGLALSRRFIFDDRSPSLEPPDVEGAATAWSDKKKSSLRQLYDQYHAAGMPLLYHSADYAPGSSGGGVFDEETGKLLGFIPMGSSVVPRTHAYAGFGQLYRVDFVCRESEVLSTASAQCAPDG